MAKSRLALLRISAVLASLELVNCQQHKSHTPVESPATLAQGFLETHKRPTQLGLDYSVVGQLLAMPAQYQRSVWQSRATDASNEALQEQAIRILSQLGDAAGIGTFFQGLLNGKRRLRILSSRALMEIGPALSAEAKNSLLIMLMREPDDSAGALAWTLVLAQDARVYDRAIDLVRKRLFSRVQYFDGRPAFDPALLGALNLPRTLSLARDSDPEVRRLVAATCARVAQPECAPWLLEFMKDVNPEVRVRAVPGLAKLGTRETIEVLNSTLRLAAGTWRNKYLESLRDEAGLLGLVAVLHSVSENSEQALSQITQVFELIDSHLATPRRSMLDPTGADSMADYMEHAPTGQWRYRAAQVLATMGDLRSLPVLRERLRPLPPQSKSESASHNPPIEPTEEDFTAPASLIADLADLHTESLGEIRKWTEAALVAGQLQLPVPRAEGMRALVKMDSRNGINLLYKWAKPTAALPAIHQYPPLPAQWLLAQAALRYLGRVHSVPARRLLEESLQRRPQGVNISGSAALGRDYAMLAAALNSLGIGAAQGLSEAGSESYGDLLLRFAMDPSENEQSRLEACRALAWTSNTVDSKQRILARARGIGRAPGSDNFSLSCLLETLSTRANPEIRDELVPFLLELISASDVKSAIAVARAIGRAEISEASEPTLLALLQQADTAAIPATLALLLGGRSELATLAALRMLGRNSQAQAQLQQAYYHSFDHLFDEDVERDTINRWVRNARAIEQFSPRGVRLKWVWELLGQQLRNLEFDTGPHSMTRTVFRNRLYQQALTGNHMAIDTLLLAGERGMLFALRNSPGDLSFAAYRAYFRFLPPIQILGQTNPTEASGQTSASHRRTTTPFLSQ
jgi:HEAT repeat protein